jgi:hypothetical protein
MLLSPFHIIIRRVDKKMSKKTVAMSLCLVAAGSVFAGKLYLDNTAKEAFDLRALELSEKNIEMTASSVSLNPLTDLVSISNLKIDNKNDKNSPLNIKHLEFTMIDQEKGIPEYAKYNATGMKFDVREMENKDKDKDQEKLLKYLAGSDNMLSVSSYGESKVDIKNNIISLSSGVGFENLGDFNFSFDLGGIYADIQDAVIKKETAKLETNAMKLLGKSTLSNISLSYSSTGFKDLLLALSGDKYSEADLLKEINKGIEEAHGKKDNAEVIKHLTLFKEAFEKDKDFIVEVKASTLINQELVMSLMMDQSPLSTPKKAQDLFGIEVVSKLK